MFYKNIGENIRRKREMLGISQTEFAMDIGMSTFHYGEIERGRVNMSVETIYRIAKGLGVLPYELLQVDNGYERYTLIEEKKTIEGQEYTAYGIRCDDEYYIFDVSADRTVLERLIRACNKYDLKPVHLYDVLEDFLEG